MGESRWRESASESQSDIKKGQEEDLGLVVSYALCPRRSEKFGTRAAYLLCCCKLRKNRGAADHVAREPALRRQYRGQELPPSFPAPLLPVLRLFVSLSSSPKCFPYEPTRSYPARSDASQQSRSKISCQSPHEYGGTINMFRSNTAARWTCAYGSHFHVFCVASGDLCTDVQNAVHEQQQIAYSTS